MDVFEVLDELEDILESGSRIPLMGKVLVDLDEVLDCIDQIRAVLPEEIRQARWVAKEKDRMIREAQEEGEKIIKKAQSQIEQLALENAIVKAAEQKGQEILKKAQTLDLEIKKGAFHYAEQILIQLENNLTKALTNISEGKADLYSSLKEDA
ncbi:MAG: ATPase [Bacillota bacterium]